MGSLDLQDWTRIGAMNRCEVVAQTGSLLCRRLATCEHQPNGRADSLRVPPTASRRYSRQSCLRYAKRFMERPGNLRGHPACKPSFLNSRTAHSLFTRKPLINNGFFGHFDVQWLTNRCETVTLFHSGSSTFLQRGSPPPPPWRLLPGFCLIRSKIPQSKT